MPFVLGPETLNDYEKASQLEWVEATGTGGYASGTVCGAHTRRYHGLLTVPLVPPVHRHLLVAKLDEGLEVDGTSYGLGVNEYPGTLNTHGHKLLSRFALDPFPTFTYAVGDIELEKTIFAVHGASATVVIYRLRAGAGGPRRSASMTLRPLLAFRDHHALTHHNPVARADVTRGDGHVSFQLYDSLPRAYLCLDQDAWHQDPFWIYQIEYRREGERGLDTHEDLLSPGYFALTLAPDKPLAIILSTTPMDAREALDLERDERARRTALTRGVTDERVASLRCAADSFIVERGEGLSVIAGYHWFEDWGRDTLISLPGLLLSTGRHAEARKVLATFAASIEAGLIPNRFPDGGHAPEYTAADAALWFAVAAERYLDVTHDAKTASSLLLPAVKAIVDAYRRGTRHNIRADEDGLVTQGEEGLQMTWMDAKVGPWIVTPRAGKAVEINALWYNSIGVLARLMEQHGYPKEAKDLHGLLDRTRSSFVRAFWYPEGGYLFDVVNGNHKDTSVRPNQVFAMSLPRSPLDHEKAVSVLGVVERLLLTPYGLRTLAVHDAGFRARYEGDRHARDAAYHQGTVWPYLIGPYVSAYLNVRGRSPATFDRVRGMIAKLLEHVNSAGLGSVSEIFDATVPQRPAGCISQAWSVAELLRIVTDELAGKP